MLHCDHMEETLLGDMHERESVSEVQVGRERYLSLRWSTDSLPLLLHLAFPLSPWFPPFVIWPQLRGWGRDMSCPSDHKYQFVFDLRLWWTALFLCVPLGGERSLWPFFCHSFSGFHFLFGSFMFIFACFWHLLFCLFSALFCL